MRAVEVIPHRTGKDQCPACNAPLDMAGNPDLLDIHPPVPGDFTVCVKCGVALRFGPDMKLRIPTRAEVMELEPEVRATIGDMQRQVRDKPQ